MEPHTVNPLDLRVPTVAMHDKEFIMADEELSEEGRCWKPEMEDEGSGTIFFERLDSSSYVPRPTDRDRVVAVILPFKKREAGR